MGFRYGMIAIFLGVGVGLHAWGSTCISVAGYHDGGGGVCWPDLASDAAHPTSEFSNQQHPVCGAGRIALSGDGSYSATTFSTSDVPNWAGTAYLYTPVVNPSDAQTFDYTSSTNPNPPIYGFVPNSRCYCLSTGKTGTAGPLAAAAATPVDLSSALANGAARQYPVTLDVISSQSTNNNLGIHGPVPIPIAQADSALDGRQYVNFVTNKSTCSCPNINEYAITNGADANWVGTNCQSMISAVPPPNAPSGLSVRVLTPYVSAYHQTRVKSDAWDTLTPLATIQLPQDGSHQDQLSTYNRRIWTCADPYDEDTTTGNGTINCVFNPSRHSCSNGGGTGQASAVGDVVTGGTASAKFDNVVNSKLACCLNAFSATDTYEKFDCIDNSAQVYSSFDDLWKRFDDPADGGQLNAIMLSDGSTIGASGKPRVISGFYGLDGHHCDQFSEFAYPVGSVIQHYRVDPKQMSGQQTKSGGGPGYVPIAGISHPVPNTTAWSNINGKIVGGTLAKSYPQSQQDMLTCPILVRAAMIASCPSATMVPNALTTTNDSAWTQGRCATAAGIQIHVRIEQVFEVTGTAPIVPFDTVVQMNQTTSLDVSKIIIGKVGDQCPPGTSKKGDLCEY